MKKVLMSMASCVMLMSALTSCTDAENAKSGGYGNNHKVEILSGGQIIRTYESSGKVLSEEHSDGYYFMDKATGKLIEVAGPVIITQL